MKLKYKLNLGFILIILIPIILLTLFNIYFLDNRILASSSDKLKTRIKYLNYYLDTSLHDLHRFSLLFSEKQTIKDIYKNKINNPADYLYDLAVKNNFSDVVLINSNNEIVSRGALAESYDSNFKIKKYMLESFNGKYNSGFIVTKNYSLGMKVYNIFLTASAPVYSDGKVIGIIILKKNISSLMEHIRDIVGSNEYAMEIFSDNEKVFSYGKSVFHPNDDIKNLDQKIIKEDIVIDYDKEKNIAVYSRAKNIENDNLILIKLTYLKSYYCYAKYIYIVVILAVAFLLIAVFFFLKNIIDKYYVNPLLDLTFRVNSYIRGDRFSLLDISRNDEIGELKKSFNEMINKIYQSNKALSESESMLNNIFNVANIGICLLDEFGKHIRFNKKYYEMLGYMGYELANINFEELLHKDFHSIAKQAFKQLQDGIIDEYVNEWDIVNKRGNRVNVLVNTCVIKSGMLNKNVLVTMTDITNIKQSQKRFVEQQQMLVQQSKLAAMGEMLGNIAHQWRQPLSNISGLLINLQTSSMCGSLDEENIDKFCTECSDLLTYMSHTIEDFVSFYQYKRKKEVFDIFETCLKAVSIVKSSYAFYGIEIEASGDSISYDGYPNEFSQALLNLLSNAKDILVERQIVKPKVNIIIKECDGEIIVMVKDNGGGIKARPMDKIFEPYFSSKKSGMGTGIGLYMSKIIIEVRMKGNITVYNDKQGAVFEIKL